MTPHFPIELLILWNSLLHFCKFDDRLLKYAFPAQSTFISVENMVASLYSTGNVSRGSLVTVLTQLSKKVFGTTIHSRT